MSRDKTRLDIKVFGIEKEEITGDKNYTAPIQKARRQCYDDMITPIVMHQY